MKLEIPQLIVVALLSANLGLSLARDGEQVENDFASTLLATVIFVVVLTFGGFFG